MKKKPENKGQFNYLGRWVDKEAFRTFVYNEKGEQKLVKSYEEFESSMASGIWFAKKPVVSNKGRRQKDDALCPAS